MPREEAATAPDREKADAAKTETKKNGEKKIPFIVVTPIKDPNAKKGTGEPYIIGVGETVELTKSEAKAFDGAVRPKTALDEPEAE